jgi:nitrate reductase NapD
MRRVRLAVPGRCARDSDNRIVGGRIMRTLPKDAAHDDQGSAALFNMCGVVVHTQPEKAKVLAERLSAMDGVHVHEIADMARIVITVEDTETTRALDTITQIHRLEGVIAAGLVYHHFEPVTPDADGTEETRI